MARAVELAEESARPGDNRLAGSRLREFRPVESYEHRGRVFKQLVRSLAEKNEADEPARRSDRARIFNRPVVVWIDRALCLVGAVMVFSARRSRRATNSAAVSFLLHRFSGSCWACAMMLVMNVDYRKLRRPEVVFTGLFAVLVMLVGAFFPRQVARDASLDSPGSGQPATFRLAKLA